MPSKSNASDHANKTWRPETEGDVHPKCGEPVVRRAGMFFFRGWSGDGLVCSACNALWMVPDEPNIFEVAAEHGVETP